MNPSRAHCIEESYLKLMACVLAGYALLGKGFAYFGYPPVFVGEIVLVIGVVVLLHVGCVFASLATLPSVLLIITMVWTVFRTLPFLDVYALDALRDSVVILYGVFSFIIIALVLQDDRRVEMLIGYYRRFLVFFVPAIFFIYPISRLFPKYIPNGFATNIPLIWVDSGQVAVHLAGAALFALVGFRKAGLIWTALLIVTALMASAMSRGGMLAFVVPITIAMILLRRIRQLGLMLAISASILGCAYSIQTNFAEYQQPKGSKERSLNAQQMIDNIVSLFGQADRQTEGTKTWRLDWWGRILRDTVGGPHFWTGRGFGLNLGDADGFRDTSNPQLPPLRSPHSVHMTILARAGVPGFMLWTTFLISWFGTLVQAMWSARRLGEIKWAGLFLFISCYGLSFMINASFDVALEGPMQGIWFWCLVGFGIGSTMSYRYRHPVRSTPAGTMCKVPMVSGLN